ncbi:hypothetical protein H5V45_14375 [Nocardioides sp. KIGAM211]|uniref:Uncharacterized protein n=1 Tax=Nocardioides luti TaxID=2761101 RepID=A0A7X0RHR6_9ACTN|nr:hypothetical protein [Nocardioides luti]MBB6628507.1 hypothetical protein [Nocardioides luti]
MDNNLDAVDANEQTVGGLSRRSVVRTAAHAAWVAPAIAVATAAPALAVSGKKAKVKVKQTDAEYDTTTTGKGKKKKKFVTGFSLTTVVANNGNGDTDGPATLTVSFSKEKSGPFSKPPTLEKYNEGKWTLSGKPTAYTFTFVSNGPIDAHDDKAFRSEYSFNKPKYDQGPATSVSVAASATKGGADSDTVKLPKFDYDK